MSKEKERKDHGLYPNKPEVRLEEALEHLRIMLSVEMKDLRHQRGLTQSDLAEQLGVGQPWISKLEGCEHTTEIESILRYLFALDAELVVGILDGEGFLPVTEAAEEWQANGFDVQKVDDGTLDSSSGLDDDSYAAIQRKNDKEKLENTTQNVISFEIKKNGFTRSKYATRQRPGDSAGDDDELDIAG